MKKLIDIPEEIVKDLKNFIQDHLVLLVRGQKKEHANNEQYLEEYMGFINYLKSLK